MGVSRQGRVQRPAVLRAGSVIDGPPPTLCAFHRPGWRGMCEQESPVLIRAPDHAQSPEPRARFSHDVQVSRAELAFRGSRGATRVGPRPDPGPRPGARLQQGPPCVALRRPLHACASHADAFSHALRVSTSFPVVRGRVGAEWPNHFSILPRPARCTGQTRMSWETRPQQAQGSGRFTHRVTPSAPAMRVRGARPASYGRRCPGGHAGPGPAAPYLTHSARSGRLARISLEIGNTPGPA